MSEPPSAESGDEQKLVKLYMELTGTAESGARSVFMHVCSSEVEKNEPASVVVLQTVPELEAEPEAVPAVLGSRTVPVALIFLTFLCGSALAEAGTAVPGEEAAAGGTNLPALSSAGGARPSATNQLPSLKGLTLADAVNLALHQNPNILRAQKDLVAAQGIAIQTRAIALPSVGVNGGYTTAQPTDVDVIEAPGFNFGTPKNWSSQIKLVQSFYEGGRMLSALRAARLTGEQSLLRYQSALADTVLAVQISYYDVLLAVQQITVQEASVELLTRELADTNRRFEAGTVPRFNVLRAEVELANARPRLISARNYLRISKNNLANLLGLNLPRQTAENIPLSLAGKLEAEPFEIELPRALNLALEQRTELGALGKAQALRKEDLINAKAGYKPRLQGYVGYDMHNSMLSQDLGDINHGWIAGAQLTWNLFDGRRTEGRVQEAAANYERAGVDLEDMSRRIELEVRTAYSNFIEAQEVLETQRKVQEEAEEALRLARARNEAGTGTQLDVLSAQTALTEARSTQVQALHDYAAARARLQRAIGMNVPSEPAKP